jgi:hypothetical protein
MLGFPWYAIVGGVAVIGGVIAVLHRKHEGGKSYGEAGADAVKLGRLYTAD